MEGGLKKQTKKSHDVAASRGNDEIRYSKPGQSKGVGTQENVHFLLRGP